LKIAADYFAADDFSPGAYFAFRPDGCRFSITPIIDVMRFSELMTFRKYRFSLLDVFHASLSIRRAFTPISL